MSVATLLTKVPSPVLAGILKKMNLKFDDIKHVKFTFERDPDRASGSHLHAVHKITGEVRDTINIDLKRLWGYEIANPWMKNCFYNTLIHEMQHLKQCLDGRFTASNNSRYAIWDGVRCLSSKGIEEEALKKAFKTGHEPDTEALFRAYKNLPWEKDADAVSRRVVNELIEEGLIEAQEPPPHPVEDDDDAKPAVFVIEIGSDHRPRIREFSL